MVPVWLGDTIYYLSDRDWTMNVFAYDTRSKKTRKVTNHTDYDVLWPSGSGDELVYEAGGYIYRLDTKSGKEERVPIKVYGDFPDTVPYFKNVKSNIELFSLSPSGARALFDARGDIFTAPAKEGEVRNLTDSQGVREMAPAWSPDGRWVAYLSDRSGEYEIYVRPSDGTGEERRVTTDGDIWRFPGRLVARQHACSLTATRSSASDTSTSPRARPLTLTAARRNDITNYSWAPDSRWIAYTKLGDNQFSEIWVYSLAGGQDAKADGRDDERHRARLRPEGALSLLPFQPRLQSDLQRLRVQLPLHEPDARLRRVARGGRPGALPARQRRGASEDQRDAADAAAQPRASAAAAGREGAAGYAAIRAANPGSDSASDSGSHAGRRKA